jgi:hypothetical protein
MNARWSAVALAAVALSAAPAAGIDPSKIDRVIQKEPAYQAKPRYCLLVFGPEAKTRVWLALDGDTLYFDRNADGDLTAADEQVAVPAFKPTSASDPFREAAREIVLGDIGDGDQVHTKLTFGQSKYRKKIGKVDFPDKADEWQGYQDELHRQTGDGVTCFISVDIQTPGREKPLNWFAWLDDGGHLALAGSREKAPVIHFGGPLTMLSNPGNKIRRDPGPLDDFTVHVGSAGSGPGSFAYMTYDPVPRDVFPVLEVEYPAKDPGGPPVRERYELKERC